MKTYQELRKLLDEASGFNPKKYRAVWPGDDGEEYGGDLGDAFKELHTDLKKLVRSGPLSTGTATQITQAIGNILGIK
jgi:hypothetical protein